MKLKKKLFTGFFILCCMMISIGLLSSCKKKENSTKDNQILEVYQSYVANAQAQGEQPLSYEDWLKTIKGTDGKDGLSAFEIYKKYHPEYTGTEQQWIENLAGTNGTNGKSAYELAVENGYKGTEIEWLASLVGSDGLSGKNAYELAVENGYIGTVSQWLSSLIGTNGTNGKSAYELAVENGYEGTEIEWLASLVGESQGVEDIEINVDYDTNGNQVFIFTFTMSDGTKLPVSAIVPKIVRNIQYIEESRFPMVSSEEEKPTLRIYVEYTDFTYATLEVTEDMIVEGEIDFTTEGTYPITISINNCNFSGNIEVYDPNRRDLVNAQLNYSNVIWLQSDIENQTLSLYPINWQLQYSNTDTDEVDLTLDQIDLSSLNHGLNLIDLTYESFQTTLKVMVCTEDELQNLTLVNSSMVSRSSQIFTLVNTNPDLSELVISFTYEIDQNMYDYFKPVTIEMLDGFDNTQMGYQNTSILNYPEIGTVSFLVYERVEPTSDASLSTSYIKVVPSGFPNLSVMIMNGMKYIYDDSSMTSVLDSYTIQLTSDMIVGTVDFSTVGDKEFSFMYNEKEYSLFLEVYDPEISNIRYMYVQDLDSLTYFVNQVTIEEIQNLLLTKELYISLYEAQNGQNSMTTSITLEMLDLSAIDITKQGEYSFTVTYDGFVIKENVVLNVDLSQEEVYKVLSGANGDIPLYANGYTVIDETQYTYELIENNSVIIFKQNDKKLTALNVNLEENTYEDYDFAGATILAEFTCDMGSNGVLEIKAYDNGLAAVSGGMVVGFEDLGDSIIVYTMYGPSTFIKGENNTLILVED